MSDISSQLDVQKLAALLKTVKLRPHQEEAVQYIQEQGGRGLLAHGTGSGKTLSGIAAFEAMKSDGKAKRALVVAPASLRDNFTASGVEKFTDSTYAHGVDGKSDYQVVSYALFRKDPDKYIQESGADTLIMDEVHRGKDRSTKTYRSLRDAASNVNNVIGLTGSLVSNHPKDIIPLMDIIHGTEHGLGTQRGFQKVYTKTKQQKGGFLKTPKKRTELVRKPRLSKNIKGKVHYIGHEDISGDMPRLDVQDVRVPMSSEQNKLYNFSLGNLTASQRAKIRAGLPVDQTEAQHILSAITKARQASNSIGTHKDITMSESAKQTPKIKRVLDDVESHLKRNKDGQAVLYTNLVRGGADVLVQGLKDLGHNPGLFAGVGAMGVSKKSRQQDVDDFKSGKKKVIVLTPAASEGVSLDNATGFFEIDRHYNPERNQQAIARGRRIGGQSHRNPNKRVLEVKRYYSEPKPSLIQRMLGTKLFGVDEWIGVVANEKQRLNDDIRDVVKTAGSDSYIGEFAKLAIQKATELENIEWEYEPYDKLINSRVRMPGPEREKTPKFTTRIPEISKPHSMLQSSQKVGKTEAPIKIEGIN